MKSVQFRKQPAGIRYLKEQKRVKPKFNWDRLIYIFVLVAIGFVLVRYLYNKSLFVEANGHVLFEKVQIRNTDDCRIVQFYINEGDSVHKNDTLFAYIDDNDNYGGSGGNSVFVSNTGAGAWAEKEIYNLKKSISLKWMEFAENKKQLTKLKDELDRIKNEVLLDLLPKYKMDSYLNQISRLEFDNKMLGREIYHLNQYLKTLKVSPDKANIVATNGGSGSSQGQLRYFICPIDSGTVTQINKQPYEVALKTENILSIHKPKNIYIKAFFDLNDLEHLKEEDLVDIQFPDGTQSQGRVKRFYFATYKLPEEFQKKYEPTTRSIAADIYSIDEDELKRWRFFYKMSVKIQKSKFFTN